MTHFETLNDLFIEQLQDIYDAEHQLIEALPAMTKAANDKHLEEAFTSHYNETLKHVSRLTEVFQSIGAIAERKTCKAMAGLIRESEEVLQCSGDRDVIDAALIAAAQRIQHYKIAGYGTVKAFAKRLDQGDAAKLLDETLDDASDADKKLNKLAEGGLVTRSINKDAAEV